MENARELLMGRFAAHFAALRAQLEAIGYARERRDPRPVGRRPGAASRARARRRGARRAPRCATSRDLWAGLAVRDDATHVRRAIGHLPPVAGRRRAPERPDARGAAQPLARQPPAARRDPARRRLVGRPRRTPRRRRAARALDAAPRRARRLRQPPRRLRADVVGSTRRRRSSASAATSATAATRTPSRIASARSAKWRSCRAFLATTSSSRRASPTATATSATPCRRSSPTRSRRS